MISFPHSSPPAVRRAVSCGRSLGAALIGIIALFGCARPAPAPAAPTQAAAQPAQPGSAVAPTNAPRESVAAPPPAPREIIAAPPPAPREIIPAPPPAPPAQRQIIAAPPEGSAASVESTLAPTTTCEIDAFWWQFLGGDCQNSRWRFSQQANGQWFAEELGCAGLRGPAVLLNGELTADVQGLGWHLKLVLHLREASCERIPAQWTCLPGRCSDSGRSDFKRLERR